MKRWRHALVALCGFGCSGRSPSPGRKPSAPTAAGPFLSPFLSIVSRPTPPPARDPAAQATANQAAVALALGTRDEAALSELRAQLKTVTDAAIARAVSVDFALDADAPDAGRTVNDPAREAEAQLKAQLPALTAANALLGSPWEGPDFSAVFGDACLPAATLCVPLFAAPSGAAPERRARALAWAWSNAAIVRAPSPEAFTTLSRGLRASASASRDSGATTIALVLDARTGSIDQATLAPLRTEAARALRHLPAKAPERAWLTALSNTKGTWTLPWALGPQDLLVIPRLSVLSHLSDFVAEVQSAGALEWRVRPVGP